MSFNLFGKYNKKLYFQFWTTPIIKDCLLSILTPHDLQTLVAMCAFINEDGRCYPSLKRLKDVLGLKTESAVSNRIRALEKTRYKGKPILKVFRNKKKILQGKIVFSNNHYEVNSEIVSIFKH